MPTHLILTLAFASLATAGCKNLTIVEQNIEERGIVFQEFNVTVPADVAYRVSPGIVCQGATVSADPLCPSGTCGISITNGTRIASTGTINVTLSRKHELSDLFKVVGHNLAIPFSTHGRTTLGKSGAETLSGCIPETWAGYVTFTPLMNCVDAVAESCTGASVADGTPLRLCAPLVGQDRQLAGTLVFLQSTPQVASALGPVPRPDPAIETTYLGTTNSPVPVSTCTPKSTGA